MRLVVTTWVIMPPAWTHDIVLLPSLFPSITLGMPSLFPLLLATSWLRRKTCSLRYQESEQRYPIFDDLLIVDHFEILMVININLLYSDWSNSFFKRWFSFNNLVYVIFWCSIYLFWLYTTVYNSLTYYNLNICYKPALLNSLSHLPQHSAKIITFDIFIDIVVVRITFLSTLPSSRI